MVLFSLLNSACYRSIANSKTQLFPPTNCSSFPSCLCVCLQVVACSFVAPPTDDASSLIQNADVPTVRGCCAGRVVVGMAVQSALGGDASCLLLLTDTLLGTRQSACMGKSE